MSFLIAMKASFRADFLRLNRDMQSRVNSALSELEQDPVTPRGDTIKKLRYHDNLWRYRIGDYRLVYAAYPNRHLVQLLGIAPRGEIYERMNYHPDEPQYADYSVALEKALDPDQETPPEWLQYLKPPENIDESRTLPYRLTPERLIEWRVPAEYHQHFIDCETENDLQNCGAPDTYILHLVDLLWPADAARMVGQPNLVVQKPEDLSCYAAGDLIDFLLLLDADQERFVDWALSGPTLVKGGPGSGKSTVAMYRVKSLLDHADGQNENPRVLFTTYTNSLVEYSRQLISHLLDESTLPEVELEVSTIDRIAWRIVNQVDGRPDMADYRDMRYALASARVAYQPPANSALEATLLRNALGSLRDEYLLEEIEWTIEGQGLKSLQEYLAADRSGRGYALDERMRTAVWAVYQHALRFLEQLGKISWGQLRNRALEIVQNQEWLDHWDYVVVDEAQDLAPSALALCVELCKSPQGIFLTADASQSLYNKGFAWKNVHESLKVVGRTRILRRNYRTTRQISEAANAVIRGTGAGDEEALDQIFVHVGPKPVQYAALDAEEGFLWLAEKLQLAARELHLPNSAIAILSPSNQLAQQAAMYLSQAGLETAYVSGKQINLQRPLAKSLTIHACKGLEFPIVAMPYVEETILPRQLPDERADDYEKHLAQERRLLFVGMTRAMRRLFIAYRQGCRSPFLDGSQTRYWEMEEFA